MTETIQNFRKLDCKKNKNCSVLYRNGAFFECKKYYIQGDKCNGVWQLGNRIGNESKGGKLYSAFPQGVNDQEYSYVFKQISFPDLESRKQFLRETNLQIKASELGLSPKIYEIFLNDDKGGIIMEKMEYTVDQLIVDVLKSDLSDTYKVTIIYSIIENMFYIIKKLGDNKILHGDIHFGNFMIKNNEIKIIDFGLGRIIKKSMSYKLYLDQIKNFLIIYDENSIAVKKYPEIMGKVYNIIKKNLTRKEI